MTYGSGGRGAYSVAVADVNGDGKPDIVVANYWDPEPNGDGSVGVLLGNGNGTFQTAVTYDSGGPISQSVAVADLNGDGKLDLVVTSACVTCPGEGSVGVLLGNGDGTFRQAVMYASGADEATSVVVADVNGDGKPDLLVSNVFTEVYSDMNGAVGVLLGNGDGTFRTAVTYSSGAYGGGPMAVADLNGDGNQDLAVGSLNGILGVLLGNGDGTFRAAVTYSSGGAEPRAVGVVDLNGDGKQDLVVSNNSSNTEGVLLGNGDGTFQAAVTFPSGAIPAPLAVADLNGDGRPDLAVGDFGAYGPYPPGIVTVLLNNSGPVEPATTTTLVSSSNPSNYGQPVTFTAAVSSTSGTPTGTVLFLDASAYIGRATLVSGGASISVSSLAVGSNSITAAYEGSGTFEASTSAPLNQVVNGVTTTTALASSLNPSIFGQPLTFTAAVSSTSGTPTGTVIFYDSSAAIGSATLAGGSASISVSSLTAGSHPITAVYQGSGAFVSSTSPPLNQVVSPATTTTSVASSANPARVRQTVTYTATVATQYGGKATGTVTFQDSGVTIATVALSNNKAAHSTSYPTMGIHSITAAYSGDLNNAGSTSSALTEDIDGATKTVVTTSGSPSFVGQPVTFTATVTSVYGAIPNGETVTFYDGTTVMGTRTTVGGVATYTTSSLTAKTHTIKATYSGDATFLPSSGTVTEVVNKYTTTTALVSSLNPSNYGQAVTLTATVTPTGPYQPTGTVTFRNGSVILGSKTLNASGVAILTTPKIPVGVDTLTATYGGDAFNGKSVSPAITQTVSQASISMVLTSYPNPSTFGTSVKFTAKLTSNGGLPSGQPVTFSYNGATLGTANVNSIGVATFYTTALPRGSDLVTAAYAGTVDYSAASATVTQVVN